MAAIILAAFLLGVWSAPVRGADPAATKETKYGARLWVMDADGQNLHQLEFDSKFTAFGSPDWLADGSKIAADAFRPDEGESWSDAHAVVIGLEDGTFEDLGTAAMPSWSPRGKRIVFSQYGPDGGVCLMNVDGSGRRLLDPDGWGIRRSPDGKSLAWTTRADGVANITVYDLIEGELRTILEGDDRRFSHIYQGFDWSADSKRICFKGIGPGGPELAITAVAGSGNGFKVRLQEETGPDVSWHPSGEHFLIHKRCKDRKRLQIYSVEADTDAPPKRIEGQDPEAANSGADWSHDGMFIVFIGNTTPPTAETAEE